MRKSTVMAMLLLSVSLIACDNQEVVEVAENTEITENIDTNENEVDPVLETEEVSEDVVAEETVEEDTTTEETVAEETVAENTTAEEPEESATEAVEETPEVPAEETTTQKVEEKVEAPVEETTEQKAETPVETPTETKSNQWTTASNTTDLENHPEWTKKRTWTASNGVVLKIRDKYSHWDFENNMAARNTYDAREVLIIDDLDLRPGTPDFDAIVEFEYGTGVHEGGTEKMKISAADLPLVATPATKLTYAPETDSWNNYKAQFDPLWSYQSTGDYESPAELYNYGSGIGLVTGVVSSYIWNLDYIGDCWKLTIRGALTELQWNLFGRR